MDQFQLTSRPRHLRFIFFVDIQYPYEKLFPLMNSNQGQWGGRYNPFIPVEDNAISEKYLQLLKYYDPDYVFYSNEINPEIIKRLRLFNPIGYYNLDTEPAPDINGINAFYFMSQFEPGSKVMIPLDLYKTNSPLLDFYKINFGLGSIMTIFDREIGKSHSPINIDQTNFSNLNQIIRTERPVNKAHLSRLNINTTILRSKLGEARYNDFELVVSKDKASINDLLYFWNRLLYEGRNTLYLTLGELDLLIQDKFFGEVLYDMNSETTIHVVSMTLSEDEIKELISTKLKPIAVYRRFSFKGISNFPFEILDGNGHLEREFGESNTTQTVNSENGLYYLPKLSFTNKIEVYGQMWTIDIEIKKSGDVYLNQIRFPLTTDTRHIVNVLGRINNRRRISVLIHNQINTTDYLYITIPSFESLLPQLIQSPVINGKVTNTKYLRIRRHDSSNKLFAFLKSFNYQFHAINEFFTDKFWVDLFIDLSTNERSAGDSIHFDEIKSKCIEAFSRKNIVLGKKEDTFRNEENLELGLKGTIGELCSYRVFLKGFKLKCYHCSSEFWYPIKEVGETVECKGCLEDFVLPIEPKFAYKLNDLIKNNIYQTKSSPSGNLTVIRTLVALQTAHYSFEYSPQINLYDDYQSNKPSNEIDIVCLPDGKFVIGESKYDSASFSADKNKSLKALVEVSIAIRPDKIILSCYKDSNSKLEKAKQGLIHLFGDWEYIPEIETLLLDEPDDFLLGEYRYFPN